MPGIDHDLIEFLITNRIPATFFMSGKWIDKHDAAVRQLLAVPYFEVGTHGKVHAHLPFHDAGEQQQEILTPVTLLKGKYGRATSLFRPPYGEFDDVTVQIVRALGLQFILWNIESGDPDPALARIIFSGGSNSVSNRVVSSCCMPMERANTPGP